MNAVARQPDAPAAPVNAAGQPTLTVLTLNIHMGLSMFKRRVVLAELREAIRSVGADLVFLQEAVGESLAMPALGTQYEFLGGEVWGAQAYGRNAVHSDGHHGNALLSKHPLLRWTNHDIAVAPFEARGLLHSEIALPGGGPPLHAICTHLGLDAKERAKQLDRLARLVTEEIPPEAPLIVAGDFNDWRQRADARLGPTGLTEAFSSLRGRPARSFPARWPLLRLDRVYLRGLRPETTQVLAGRPWSHLSDHAALAVTVALAERG